MPLPIIPPPFSDEWLGFWLLRVADRYGMRIAALLERTPGFINPPRSQTWTKRLECGEEQWAALAYLTRREPGSLKAMQLQFSAAERGTERGFCRTCLAEDLASAGIPYWRRYWMDPCCVWCHHHDRVLDLPPQLSALGLRSYSHVATRLAELAAPGSSENPSGVVPQWVQSLARCAVLPGFLHAAEGRISTPIVAELLDSIAESILVARYDDNAAEELAVVVGAPGASALGFEELRRVQVTTGSCIGQVRLLQHRRWLMGLASKIASFGPSADQGESSVAARNWLWRHLYAVGVVRLVRAVQAARTEGCICAWPEVEQWKPPTSGAAWFGHVA